METNCTIMLRRLNLLMLEVHFKLSYFKISSYCIPARRKLNAHLPVTKSTLLSFLCVHIATYFCVYDTTLHTASESNLPYRAETE